MDKKISNREAIKRTAELVMGSGNIICLCGETGVGKTDMILQLGKELNKKVITLNSAIQSAEDLIGYPYRENNVMKWARPEWFPVESDGPCILFIDEINRAEKQVINALMPMLINGVLHSHSLPKGTWVCAAMNPDTENYDMVNSFDDVAIWSRMCVVPVYHNALDWEDWLIKSGRTQSRLVKVMTSALLSQEKKFDLPPKTCSNRTFTKVLDIVEYAVKMNREKHNEDLYFDASVVQNAVIGLCGIAFAKNVKDEIELLLSNISEMGLIETLGIKLNNDNAKPVSIRITDFINANTLETENFNSLIDWLYKYSLVYPDLVKNVITSISSRNFVNNDVVYSEKFNDILTMINKFKGDVV